MANILDFLRELFTSGEEQQRFTDDPRAYLSHHGFDDLSGEDVVEAARSKAFTRPLAQDVADRLTPFRTDHGSLPSVRPQIGETELDAAVRLLHFLTSLNPVEAPTRPPPEAESQPEPEPAAVDAPSEPEPEPEPVSPQREPVSRPADAAQTAFDPYHAFGDELASIVRHAGEQMQEVLRRAEDQADAIVRAAEQEAASVSEKAHEDAAATREAATHEADAILQAAKSAREEARVFKQSTVDEANTILQTARTTHDEAQQQATELLQSAERESSAMLTEARTKRDEIREAERALRERLQGLETVYKSLQEGSVVPDDPHE